MTQLAETVTRFGLPAFILTLPLEFTSQLLRLQLARIVLLVAAAAYGYLVLAGQRKVAVPFTLSNIALATFIAVSLLSWLFTRAPGSRNGLADLVLYPLAAVLIVNLSPSVEEHRKAWVALLASGVAIAVLVWFLHITHLNIWRADPTGIRTNATFGDPDVAARFLTIAASAGIALFAARVRVDKTSLAAIASGAAFTVSTLSKASLILFPASFVVAAVFGRDHKRAAIAGLAGLLIFGASVVLTPGASPRVVRAFNQITGGAHLIVNPPSSSITNQQINQSELDLVRVYLINAGWQMFRDHPITGVGYGGYQHALTTTYKRFLPANPPATLSHTTFVTILSEEGLIGAVPFAAFLLLLLYEVIAAIRRGSPMRDWIVTPAVAIVPILAYSQLEGRLIEEPYLWLALGLLYSAKALDGSARTVRLPS